MKEITAVLAPLVLLFTVLMPLLVGVGAPVLVVLHVLSLRRIARAVERLEHTVESKVVSA